MRWSRSFISLSIVLVLLPFAVAVNGGSAGKVTGSFCPTLCVEPKAVGKAPPGWLVKDYVKRNAKPSAGIHIKESRVEYIGQDINGDGSTDWFLYDGDFCGSAGCLGDVYVCKNAAEPCKNADYCYAGGGRNDAVLNRPHPKLTCVTRPPTIE